MPFYRTDNNLPQPDRMNSLANRVSKVIAPIITGELDAGATAEEILGLIVQTVGCEISEQTLLRACGVRKAEREQTRTNM